jgi:2,3-bisphosphoglycerate-dependent phosphoglycerate mutase
MAPLQPGSLVLLRHGESEWNRQNLFTGWWDAPLSPAGEDEARAGGELLLAKGVLPDIVHTSLQTRAIHTAELALRAAGRSWIPVRRHWRLNERHYGDLTGRNKAETAAKYGDDQVLVWRRSYDTPPPPTAPDNQFDPNTDERYASVPPELLPASECLKDVVDRMLPYWFDAIVPDLLTGATVLVAAHGNSLRALVKHLDGISDDDITGLNIPTGQPLVYELDTSLRPARAVPITDRYLADPAEIEAAAERVKNQAKG